MEKLILIGGKAGLGAARTSIILGKAFAKMGYYAFNYRDYPSLIRGGHNFNILKISDAPVQSHETEYDAIIAFDENTVKKHKKNLKEGGVIIAPKSLKIDGAIELDIDSIVKKLETKPVVGNNALLGALFKVFGLHVDSLMKTFEKEFGEKAGPSIKAAQEGYDSVKEKTKVEKSTTLKPDKYFLTGNEAVGAGAIAAGLDVYIAYPMTPATSVLHYLASKQVEYGFNVIQPENEIAVVTSALGASYAGAMAMVGSSGGGFALMVEAMSLQGNSEVPLVVFLAQRPAPSTGIPTYTGQGDLKFAVNVGHGAFPRVIVAPGDAKEAFYRTMEALYLSHKFHVLTIIMSDKHLAESNYSFDPDVFTAPVVQPSRFLISPSAGYKRYAVTKDGVSPRAAPGQGPFVRATSYEHDEEGYTIEDEKWRIKMSDKRLKKEKLVEKEVAKLNPIAVHGSGKNLIISWGSTKGAIVDALPELKDFRFLQISYIIPFPVKQVKKEIEKSEKVILLENNATGMLGDIIAEKTGIFIDKKVLKYDGRPFTTVDVINGIKKVMK